MQQRSHCSSDARPRTPLIPRFCLLPASVSRRFTVFLPLMEGREKNISKFAPRTGKIIQLAQFLHELAIYLIWTLAGLNSHSRRFACVDAGMPSFHRRVVSPILHAEHGQEENSWLLPRAK